MALMDLPIIKDGIWWRLPWRNLAQPLGVLLQERIDHFEHLTGNAADDLQFPAIGPLSLVVYALLWDQSLIEPGPLAVELNSMGDTEKEHLLHGSGACMGQLHSVQSRSRDLAYWRPPAVGCEIGGALKVQDSPNRCHDSGCLNGADPGNRSEDLSLARLLYQLTNLRIQLLEMFLQEPQFSNELGLFEKEATLSHRILGADALSRQLLQLLQLGIGWIAVFDPQFSKGGERRGCDGVGCRESLSDSESCGERWVFEHLGHLWEQFITDGNQLVFPLRAFTDSLVAMTHPAFELSCCFCRGKQAADQVRLVS